MVTCIPHDKRSLKKLIKFGFNLLKVFSPNIQEINIQEKMVGFVSTVEDSFFKYFTFLLITDCSPLIPIIL